MRSALIAAALAVGALAVPYQKRAEVTNTDVDLVYVTQVVTVTAANAAVSTADADSKWHYGHHKHSSKDTKKATHTTHKTHTTETHPHSTKTTAKTSAAKTGKSGAVPTSYSEIVVYAHNLHRANHSASDIEWSNDLASSAATIASSCVYAHNVAVDGGGYGQNIAAGVEANNVSAIITNLFYNAEVGWYNGLYGEASPSMTNFEHWGHFSQIVWKKTTQVGCATHDCSSGGLANVGGDVRPYFTVCNYKSPGNMANEYTNVGKPLGHPTANWDTGL